MRQLAAFEKAKPELEKMECTVLAASADTADQSRSVVEKANLTFPMAYGITKSNAETIGAWWGNHPPDGEHIQPAEFLLSRGGVVLGSMYASGPIGRMGWNEVVRSITSRERARMEREQGRTQ